MPKTTAGVFLKTPSGAFAKTPTLKESLEVAVCASVAFQLQCIGLIGHVYDV